MMAFKAITLTVFCPDKGMRFYFKDGGDQASLL
jgi:hypothetical protein